MSEATGDTLPVTVLVPTFNRAIYLTEALESLLGQRPPPAQVIVIDDGSEDETAGIVRGFGDAVTYIHQPNSGKATALNNGLAAATQPYVWIFDDDDIAAEGTLARLHDALAADPDAGFSYGICDKFRGPWPCANRERTFAYTAEERSALYVRLMEDFFLWQGAMLVRRDCYATVGPFDVRLARSQDYEMALRLGRRFRGVGVPIVAFHQRHHEGLRGPSSARIPAADMEKAWRKYNHIIFRELHASHDLPEFCIEGDLTGGGRPALTALIQRGSIMARKGIWDLAATDFAEAAKLAHGLAITTLNEQEKAALRRIFQRGARSVFTGEAEGRPFFAAIAAFDRPLRAAIEGNLLLPLSFRLRRVKDTQEPRTELRQLWIAGRRLLRPGALSHYLDARRTDRGMYKVMPLAVA
ncbi:glycosyltransferase family 2 protein [Sphingomonas naphthae]|uniref:Glycosyltransferase family 2 protein n=1 Tax=Sphingomonas naphthae TaxID=1813468 RepID=A0ABY7TI11_9SPHN|nr:glycosyltransferase family 2 protein [Sphingomonas naphthae]WCT72533.1 glycosyltransferase family 2 protein [Sphingomonas naphthae]